MRDPFVELVELKQEFVFCPVEHLLRILRDQPVNKEGRLAHYHRENQYFEKVVFHVFILHLQDELGLRLLVNLEVLDAVPVLDLVFQ